MIGVTEQGAATLLEVKGVSRRFGGLSAVDDVSFKTAKGEVVAIVGPNGAGKTTLFNLLSGHLPLSSGEIEFDGQTITNLPAHRRARLGMGRTFQIVHPIPSLTVLENTMVGAFHAYPKRNQAIKRAEECLERLGLMSQAGMLAGNLTLGGRKRLEVARAVAGNTRLLMLDEVMAGLNPTETEEAVQMIASLQADGMTVVVVEHDLKVVRALAAHVVVLDHGAVIAAGEPNEVLDSPQVVEAYLGTKRSRHE